MINWIDDLQSKIYTTVKYRAEKKLKTKFPNIFFTTETTGSVESHLPTVYIHFLPSAETGNDRENDEVNAIYCSVQLEVTASKSQGQDGASKVMFEVLQQFKNLRFNILMLPEFLNTDSDTKRLVARVQRIVANNDTIE